MVSQETIVSIIQWLVPSGGFGAVIIWLTSKTIRNTRRQKEIHDTYKIMYEDTQNTLLRILDENKKLSYMVLRMERAINRISACSFAASYACPVSAELQKHPSNGQRREARLNGDTGEANHRPRDHTHVEGGNTDTDTRPP